MIENVPKEKAMPDNEKARSWKLEAGRIIT